MGADIHGVAQWKWENIPETAWSDIMPVPDVRSYEVFNILANVRDQALHSLADDIPLRGLPRDIHIANDDDEFKYGQHHFTWYTLDELYGHIHLFGQIKDDAARDVWVYFITYLRAYSKTWYNAKIRIVIGFDS
jgi:hypothetical protein